jgi:hypothetical protein
MKKLILLIMMVLVMSLDLNAQTATPPALGDGTEGNPFQIGTLENLYWIAATDAEVANPSRAVRFAAHYIQTANIDASETAGWSSGGWLPIGETDFDKFQYPFKGNYNGKGHTISGLIITGSSDKSYGLFGHADVAVFQNLGITDVFINIDGDTRGSGALLGSGTEVIINNCFSTGVVKGTDSTGGLVGLIMSSTLTNSYSTCDVTGADIVGGLVGNCNFGNSIINCFHTTGIVRGVIFVGGLTGWITTDSNMSKCYSTGEVIGGDSTGGLVGSTSTATISDCYSRCIVSSSYNGGGLVGENSDYGIISNCYSTGYVLTNLGLGGLVGSQIRNATTTNSFWDIETSLTILSAAGEGKTTAEMKTQSTFTGAGWDFLTIWGMNAGCNDGYPYLIQENPPLVTIACDISGEICSNMEPTFMATPFGADGGNVSYAWKLNEESVGLDQNTYTLTDLEPGYVFTVSCEITVTNNVCCSSHTASDEITIIVSASPDAGEITGENVIQVGATVQLSPTFTGGFWMSADNDIATIDEYGKVTGTGVGETTIRYIVQGGPPCNEIGWTEFLITVTPASNNTPPDVSDIIPSTTDPIALGVLFSITVSYSDIDDNVETAVIDWGDGSPETDFLTQATDETYAHTYGYPGVYTIAVSVDDGYGPVIKTYQYVIVYDPSAGFVTGGGWIESPLCSNVDPEYGFMNISGKANFGFVAKYQKGKQIPEGNTEFQFKAGNLNFKSIEYEWLVIAGAKAQFKGSGTINGTGDFGFMLSAVDANLAENTETDLFRIKIWDKDNGDVVVYDNQCGADDYADLDQTTGIAGGSIVIHSSDRKSKSGEISDLLKPAVDKISLKVYPNPFIERLNFEFISPEDAAVQIDICDISGRLVETVFKGMAEEGINYNIEFTPDAIPSGIYFYRAIMGDSVITGKVACNEY